MIAYAFLSFPYAFSGQAMGTPSNWGLHSIKWERPMNGNADVIQMGGIRDSGLGPHENHGKSWEIIGKSREKLSK